MSWKDCRVSSYVNEAKNALIPPFRVIDDIRFTVAFDDQRSGFLLVERPVLRSKSVKTETIFSMLIVLLLASKIVRKRCEKAYFWLILAAISLNLSNSGPLVGMSR